MTPDSRPATVADLSGSQSDAATPASLPRRVIVLLISILSLISLLMFGTVRARWCAARQVGTGFWDTPSPCGT